jgi:hypothetical protein
MWSCALVGNVLRLINCKTAVTSSHINGMEFIKVRRGRQIGCPKIFGGIMYANIMSAL